jgi:hypothetical protein
MKEISERGFSRVPVHAPIGPEEENPALVVLLGYLLVKDHLLTDPYDALPLRCLTIYKPVCVSPGLSLSSLLNDFQECAAHMAFVAADPQKLQTALSSLSELWLADADYVAASAVASGRDEGMHSCASGTASRQVSAERAAQEAQLVEDVRQSGIMGIVTLEDVIEVLLTKEVPDEGDHRRRHFSSKDQQHALQSYADGEKLHFEPHQNGAATKAAPFPLLSKTPDTSSGQGLFDTPSIATSKRRLAEEAALFSGSDSNGSSSPGYYGFLRGRGGRDTRKSAGSAKSPRGSLPEALRNLHGFSEHRQRHRQRDELAASKPDADLRPEEHINQIAGVAKPRLADHLRAPGLAQGSRNQIFGQATKVSSSPLLSESTKKVSYSSLPR